ncbi:MAG: insulinase family protein [Cytophagales bacterium]|nr:insulinase family protein [Cytophagales bacterium]
MIKFEEYLLSNGLTLITHQDKNTPLVVVNVLYKVGSRNEHAHHTGLAHLHEHLMFGGSRHVPDYDKVLQKVGAENNAFTNTDITDYYVILDAENIETALWTESDRMHLLNFNQKTLDVQKSVVIEEFKQRYLNIPYGDVWLKLRPLAYTQHPYRWLTIGKRIEHIEQTTLEQAIDFYRKYYTPNNAILTIAGNIESSHAYDLTCKWFDDIPAGNVEKEELPEEPVQLNRRFLEIQNNVPLNSIYKAYHMPGRGNKGFYTADILSDLLGRGKSSRLHQNLVKSKQIFNNLNAYILGTEDPGLLVISGKINPGIDINDADNYIIEEIDRLLNHLEDSEVEKTIHQAESSNYFSEVELLNRSIGLAVANSLGNTNLVNEEINTILNLDKKDVLSIANDILLDSNCSTLHYKMNN